MAGGGVMGLSSPIPLSGLVNSLQTSIMQGGSSEEAPIAACLHWKRISYRITNMSFLTQDITMVSLILDITIPTMIRSMKTIIAMLSVAAIVPERMECFIMTTLGQLTAKVQGSKLTATVLVCL